MKLKFLFLFLAATPVLFAQKFTEVPQSGGPFEDVSSSSIAFADVDGDADPDVLITGLNSLGAPISKLYTNDGEGTFTEVAGTPFERVWGSSIAFADVDGDNDQDVLITGGFGSLILPYTWLYTNDGEGHFTEVTSTPFEGVWRSSIAFADVDGDGDPDVLITGSNSSGAGISKLYTNDGEGIYTEVTGTPFEGVANSSIAFADIDGDSDPDVLITGRNNFGAPISKLYTNDGGGHFIEVTGTPFEGVEYSSIAFADVDGDGDPDVLITGAKDNFGNDLTSTLYTNDGSGHFTEVAGTPFEGVWRSSIAFADVDGDADPDVLLTGSGISKLYTNDGSGTFTEMTGTPFEGVGSSSIAFADVDGDADPDVLLTGSGNSGRISELYTNDGTGTYTALTGTPFEGVWYGSIAFADVDGDNDQDVLITGENSLGLGISKLYINEGSGHFTEVTSTPFESVDFSSIAFADVDGDADPDVLITGLNNSFEGISKLYTNDGSGNYTEVAGTPFEDVGYSSIAFADVDGDADPDVLLTGQNNSFEKISKLYTNDGTGTYTEMKGTLFEGVSRSSIAFADVDGDADPDVLLTGESNSFEKISKLYTNDGSGNYTEVAGTPFEGVSRSSIAFADVDGDADPDVLLTGESNSFEKISKLYTNDGSGNYTEVAGTPFEGVSRSSIAFADVDGDADPDVLLTGSGNSGRISELYTNDGTGTYTALTGTPFEGVWYGSIAFADVDGDGEPDVLITGQNNSPALISKLYINDGTVSSFGDLTADVRLNLTLFPNPAMSTGLNISFHSTESTAVMVRIYDLKGRLIRQQKEMAGTGAQTLLVDITSLSAGSYFIQLENGKQSGVARFIVP